MAMLDDTGTLVRALTNAGMATLISNFRRENVETDMILRLSDQELSRLGVQTIGDRVRLKESIKQLSSSTSVTNDHQTTSSSAGRFMPHRNSLFHRPSSGHQKPKTKKLNGWTAQFVCLADNEQRKVPTASEKDILLKAGLGYKKIRLEDKDDEEAVLKKITSGDKDENGEVRGFPQLQGMGGFELMRTIQNNRNLEMIEGPWSAKDLKKKIGSQARMYIRPIQKSVSTKPLQSERESPKVKAECQKCRKEFFLHEMRQHFQICISKEMVQTETSANEEILQGETGADEETLQTETGADEETFETVVVEEMTHDTSITDQVLVLSPLTGIWQNEVPHNYSVEEANATLNDSGPSHAETTSTADASVSPAESGTDPIKEVVQKAIGFCKENGIENPVEILKKLQTSVVTGRGLEVETESVWLEGETNCIFVDRDCILNTGMEEIEAVEGDNIRKTLEVQFYNEEAVDLGGPRKEFFRLIMMEIKEKYFEKGLRELLSDDYKTVGIIFALSILQNGKIPTFMTPDLLEELWNSQHPSACISKLREGLDSLGIYEVCCQMPTFRFLFFATPTKLTVKRVVELLKPEFSEEGSNKYFQEKTIYSTFVKYLREVASGRRGNLTLSSVLVFVTSVDEEPALGFKIHPTIKFAEVTDSGTYLPTANTCINSLTLPRPSGFREFPKSEEIFRLYDYAFSNTFYGLK